MQKVHKAAFGFKRFRDDTEVDQLRAVWAMLVAHIYNRCMLGGGEKTSVQGKTAHKLEELSALQHLSNMLRVF